MLAISYLKKPDTKTPLLTPIFADDVSAQRRKIFRGLSRAQKRAVRSVITNHPVAKSGIVPVYSGDAVVFLYILDKNAKVTTREAREAGEKVFGIANSHKITSLIIAPGSLEKDRFAAFEEGITLGSYEFLEYKGKKSDEDTKANRLSELKVIADGSKRDIDLLQNISGGVALAKDIINTPPSDATPEYVMRKAEEIAKEIKGVSVKTFLKKDLEKLGMGGILGVGRGSKYEPRLIILEYNGGKKNEAPLALVGKGVTFDTGGNNIKTGGHMRWMKQDLGGAATMLGAFYIAAKSGAPKNIIALVPSVENMVSRDAYFPDDILRMYNGVTVEVHNTDAEGRLILADALAYAEEKYQPRAMIDAATLTGACAYAVGNDFVAGLTNNQRLFNSLKRNAETVDEPMWQLPLHQRYNEMLKSKTADIVNCSSGLKPGTIEGALFLQNFVTEKTPWVHLDIASVTFDEKVGLATGRTVRTLAQFAQTY